MLDFDFIEKRLEQRIKELYESREGRKREVLLNSYRVYIDLISKKGSGYRKYYEDFIPFLSDYWNKYNKQRREIGKKYLEYQIGSFNLK